MKKSTVGWVAGACGLMAAAGLLVGAHYNTPTQVPDDLTFDITLRAQNDEDRAAIRSYKGREAIDISDGRLLAVDNLGWKYLIAPSKGQVCLVVIKDEQTAAGACDESAIAGQQGLWLKTGGNQGDRLVILVPDAYADATIQGSNPVELSAPNLRVLKTERDQKDSVRLTSTKFKPIEIDSTPHK